MVEKILNNTTPYGKVRASHEGWLHTSTLTVNTRLYGSIQWAGETSSKSFMSMSVI